MIIIIYVVPSILFATNLQLVQYELLQNCTHESHLLPSSAPTEQSACLDNNAKQVVLADDP